MADIESWTYAIYYCFYDPNKSINDALTMGCTSKDGTAHPSLQKADKNYHMRCEGILKWNRWLSIFFSHCFWGVAKKVTLSYVELHMLRVLPTPVRLSQIETLFMGSYS